MNRFEYQSLEFKGYVIEIKIKFDEYCFVIVLVIMAMQT